MIQKEKRVLKTMEIGFLWSKADLWTAAFKWPLQFKKITIETSDICKLNSTSRVSSIISPVIIYIIAVDKSNWRMLQQITVSLLSKKQGLNEFTETMAEIHQWPSQLQHCWRRNIQKPFVPLHLIFKRKYFCLVAIKGLDCLVFPFYCNQLKTAQKRNLK